MEWKKIQYHFGSKPLHHTLLSRKNLTTPIYLRELSHKFNTRFLASFQEMCGFHSTATMRLLLERIGCECHIIQDKHEAVTQHQNNIQRSALEASHRHRQREEEGEERMGVIHSH